MKICFKIILGKKYLFLLYLLGDTAIKNKIPCHEDLIFYALQIVEEKYVG
jgi:hypothetical protein